MKIKDNIIFKHKPIVRVTQKRCLKDYKKYRHPKNSKKKIKLKAIGNLNENLKKNINHLQLLKVYILVNLIKLMKIL